MIGIIIITHSGLARELLQVAEMILGPLTAVKTVSIDRDMSVEVAKEELQLAIDLVGNDGDGVMILTDLFGGTPTNISVDFLQEGFIEILTGVNLPMLIKCAGARVGQSVDGLASLLKDYARNSIMRPSDLLHLAEKLEN
jgi:PTS system mannose-specific IIA component